MTSEDNIIDEKLQYHINKEAGILSGKFDKYEYDTGEETLPSDQGRITKYTSFTYYPLGNALEKQARTFKDQGVKQITANDLHGKQLATSN